MVIRKNVYLLYFKQDSSVVGGNFPCSRKPSNSAIKERGEAPVLYQKYQILENLMEYLGGKNKRNNQK